MRQKFWHASIGALAAGALALSTGSAMAGNAAAEEPQAKAMLKAMSDYLGEQKNLSFDYDTDLEMVSKDKQKLGLASSGTIDLKRPDQLRATRHGGFADVELLYDGKTVTMLGKDVNAYGQAQMPGTVDQLVDQLRDKYQRPIPGADLLLSNVYDELMPQVVDAKDLGMGVINGVECNHLAFRTNDVDWQIWVADGERPYPCRYVITSKQVEGFPEYRLDIRNWKTGSDVTPMDVTFTPPADAKKVELGSLRDTDELPSIYASGVGK